MSVPQVRICVNYAVLVSIGNGILLDVRDNECLSEKADNIKEIVRRNNLKDAVYIGDTMGDYNATKETGLPFIHAAYGFGEVPEADFVVNEPLDLLKIL